MFIRIKKFGHRRYAYLVEGSRANGRVSQRTVCYLGPMSRICRAGVTDPAKAKLQLLKVDWKRVNCDLARFPLSFEELSEIRRAWLASSAGHKRQGPLSGGYLKRTEGEFGALIDVARVRFAEMFEQTGEREYIMR